MAGAPDRNVGESWTWCAGAFSTSVAWEGDVLRAFVGALAGHVASAFVDHRRARLVVGTDAGELHAASDPAAFSLRDTVTLDPIDVAMPLGAAARGRRRGDRAKQASAREQTRNPRSRVALSRLPGVQRTGDP